MALKVRPATPSSVIPRDPAHPAPARVVTHTVQRDLGSLLPHVTYGALGGLGRSLVVVVEKRQQRASLSQWDLASLDYSLGQVSGEPAVLSIHELSEPHFFRAPLGEWTSLIDPAGSHRFEYEHNVVLRSSLPRKRVKVRIRRRARPSATLSLSGEEWRLLSDE